MRPLNPQQVDRLLHRPMAVVQGARRLTHGALDNALRSVEEITRSIEDRRLLQEGLSDPAQHGDLGALETAECLELLASRSVGRLAYIARAGVPDVVPVNYALDDGHLFVRSGAGPKLQAAERRDVVAFEVDAIDEDDHSGWSVVVTGRLAVVDPDEVLPDALPVPWANGPRRHLIRLTPQRVSGRRLIGGSGAE